MAVDQRILDFVGKLRAGGMKVSLAESMDACRALEAVPLAGINVLRVSLRSTLVKRESDYPLFEAVFDEYFTGVEALMAGEPGGEEPGGEGEPVAPGDVSRLLFDAILTAGDDEIAALAALAAAMVGQMEGGFSSGSRPISIMAGSGYYMFRAMEMLGFQGMAAELEESAAQGEVLAGMPPVLALEEVRERLERFRIALEKEILRRITLERGEDATRRRKKLPVRPEEIDFTGASLRQVEEMRKVLPALARRLAARLARRHGAGKWGRVDIRRTLRHSLSSGGVPIDVKYRKRVPVKPELFVLCDVSGSVRTFSTFMLQLVYSLHQQFRAVRSFAFIDRVDEVTDCFNRSDVGEAVERVFRESLTVDGDGHSDIGRALDMFRREYADDISPRLTVIILSDARNNARDPRADALRVIGEKARKVFWLNPEPMERWDTGDSVIDRYREHCHSVHECRNLVQLTRFVYREA